MPDGDLPKTCSAHGCGCDPAGRSRVRRTSTVHLRSIWRGTSVPAGVGAAGPPWETARASADGPAGANPNDSAGKWTVGPQSQGVGWQRLPPGRTALWPV